MVKGLGPARRVGVLVSQGVDQLSSGQAQLVQVRFAQVGDDQVPVRDDAAAAARGQFLKGDKGRASLEGDIVEDRFKQGALEIVGRVEGRQAIA